MKIRTLSVTVPASRDTVYNFLADIENLPKWATEFCERIELRHNGWWAYTSQGEMMVESEADDHTGVIDLRVGPSVDALVMFPLRVFPLTTKRTLVSFTFIQPAELPDEQQKVLQLAYFEGLSQTEISEKLAVPLGTIKTRMRNATIKLRESFSDRLRALL